MKWAGTLSDSPVRQRRTFCSLSQCPFLHTHLHFLLVLEPPLAHDDVLNAPPVTELLLEDSVIFKELLGLVFWDSIQGILVNDTHSFELEADVPVSIHHALIVVTAWRMTVPQSNLTSQSNAGQ